MIRFIKLLTLLFCSIAIQLSTAHAQSVANAPKIHIVYMGGNDCPPCVDWKQKELPKLEAAPIFKRITFSYVTKTIRSQVPLSLFLPSEVKPYKDKLDYASNGIIGSAQTAILVNGEVFDYKFGSYSAAEFEKRLRAIETGELYPFDRCVKLTKRAKCEEYGF